LILVEANYISTNVVIIIAWSISGVSLDTNIRSTICFKLGQLLE